MRSSPQIAGNLLLAVTLLCQTGCESLHERAPFHLLDGTYFVDVAVDPADELANAMPTG